MKFLQTSDIHLGAKFSWLGELSEKHRQDLKASFEKLVELAIEKKVAFVAFCGDIFDSPYPSELNINFVRDQFYKLSDNNIKSLVICGNHDRLEEGSVWTKDVWASDKNIFVFTEPRAKFLSDTKTWIYPTVIANQKSKISPLSNLISQVSENKIEQDPNFHIILAHGSLNLFGISDNFPISQEDIETSKADFVALGDWHSTLNVGTQIKAYYSGSLELIDSSQKGSGNVLYINIENDNYEKKIVVEQIKISNKTFQNLTIDLEIFDNVDNLNKEISKFAGPNNILNLKVIGINKNNINIEELYEFWKSKFFYINLIEKIDQNQVLNSEEIENLFEEGTTSAEFVKLMKKKIQENPQDETYYKALNIGINLLKSK